MPPPAAPHRLVDLGTGWSSASPDETGRTTTRLPLASDCTACSVWSRHTTTMKNDASCASRGGWQWRVGHDVDQMWTQASESADGLVAATL